VGRHEEAVKRSEQFLRAKWDRELTPKTLLIQGYCLGRLNRAPESVATYQLLVDRFPDTAFAAQGAHLMAMAYFRSGQYVPIVTHVNHQWSALNADVRAKQPAALFWIGEAHLKLKNGPEARDAYQKFIDIAPPDHPLMAQAVYGQAVSYVEEGDVNNAVLTLQRAFQSASEKGDKPFMGALMLKTGDVHYNAKNYEEAAAAYRNFQTIDAKHSDMPVAMYREGLALHRAEYYSDAVTAWEKLVKAHPRFDKSPDALFRAAKTRFDMAQYPEAVKGYETLIKAYSKTEFAKDARLQIGQCWYNAGDFGRAIVHYTDFLNRFPDDPRAPGVLQLLQTAYFQAKKSPAEIEKLTKNQPKTPVLADIYWEEGAKRYNEKDYDKARDYFQKIIFEFPSSSLAAQASFYRAESFFLQEKFQEAAPAYQNFIQSYPEDGQISLAKFHMAISLFNRNEFAQAAEAFKDFARAFPDDPMAKNASLNAALCYAKSNDVDAATAAYEEYLKLYPDAEDAGAVYLQMGALLEKSGKEERAAEAYKSVPASLAEAPEAYFGAARCYQKLKKTEQEKEAYELLRATANKADPYRISGLLQLSNIYLTESQPDRALAVCRDVLQNAADPQSQAAAQECVNGLQQGGAQ
jgi:TolA-binding protein